MATAAAVPAPSWAQLQSKRRELGQVQKELERTRREIEEFERLEQTLGRELTRLESRNAEAKRRFSQIQRNLRAAQARKGELSSRLVSLGRATGFWRTSWEAELAAHQAGLAERGEFHASGSLWGEALARGAILEKARLVRGLEGLGRRTAQAEAESGRRAKELLSRSLEAEAERESGRRRYLEAKSAIAEAQERRAAAVKKAKELEESAKALNRLIAELSRARRPARGDQDRWLAARGSLPWPATGKLVQSFGRRRNPELDTWVIHQGVKLETAPAAPVGSVAEGRVIFSGPFRSYGQVVILDHGGNFFSIYGELGGPLKEKGARVRAGEAVGTAGPSGAAGRGTVYLEFRRGTEAVDPLPWLKTP